jgi:Asp-tRNA(Asn)/Glu-tRNA(Gln) amidotransferase A subunit family amidase
MSSDVSRRELLSAAAALGIGGATFQRAVAAVALQQPKGAAITAEMVKNAEWVAGVTLTDDQRRSVAARLSSAQGQLAAIRKVAVGTDVPPAMHFTPTPGEPSSREPRGEVAPTPLAKEVVRPDSDADLAFLTVRELADLVRRRAISSTELTKLYLTRLKKYDPALLCVVSLTEELALKQAAAADREIAAGKYRGPLHGIPWVAKDLIAYPGYKTTWGAAHFKDQMIDVKATAAERLDAAGAVLVAKTTLGALAMGDQWFGGMTRNPWNVRQGSSGSSAGTASAVAAGLAPFGLGSETHGSIVSPSTRCGVTGLRPTFGRVSRAGCMTLCWSLDKLGPLARSVEDCALVLGAVHGADPKDPDSVDRPFRWPGERPPAELRVGTFEGQTADADLKVLRELGVKLVPMTLPRATASAIIGVILDVESATAFDDITRDGVTEGIGAWWSTFRKARFVSAVDYLRAQRARTLLMAEMAKAMETVDLYVGGNDLQVTNLTGHPTICLPSGFTKSGTPTAITFTGRLYGETDLLTVAKAYQDATGHHKKRPPEETWVVEKEEK